MTKPVLLWLRRELRLRDNAALLAAIASGRPVLPVFILDETTPGAWAPGGASRWWLHHSLSALAHDLAQRGAPLVLRRGAIADELPKLVAETDAAELHAGVPTEPWARRVVDSLGTILPTKLHRTATLFGGDEIRTQTGGPYNVFTPFARACRARLEPGRPRPVPNRIEAPTSPRSDRLEGWGLLPVHPDWAGGLRETWQPGEAGGHARLSAFVEHGLTSYDRTRDFPGSPGTSSLSPHLAFGEISPDEAWHAAARAGDSRGKEVWQNELLWREFSAHLLWHNPSLPEAPLRPEFAKMPWRDDPVALAAWQRGATGIPIVDAGMRQLWHTGWMHNRVRMIVASFLAKHLLLQWQHGEAWFWDTLVDADLASNSAQWQWVAGCGPDAAPYFRIFNPVLQGRKFDADGTYVARWVPELASLPPAERQAPWEAPDMLLRGAGVILGQTYPHPIVDLAAGRHRALAALAAAATDRFVVQLGDLTDEGPDSAGALKIMFSLIDAGRGLFVLGNHDFKLFRALAGHNVRIGPALAATLAQLDPPLRERTAAEIARAPAWVRHGNTLFVHGGFHRAMLEGPPPPTPDKRPDAVVSRALYGEPTGRTQPDGFPERSLAWVELIPAGLTV
jgi:deoxyribodipyrimidine photo-lyase